MFYGQIHYFPVLIEYPNIIASGCAVFSGKRVAHVRDKYVEESVRISIDAAVCIQRFYRGFAVRKLGKDGV